MTRKTNYGISKKGPNQDPELGQGIHNNLKLQVEHDGAVTEGVAQNRNGKNGNQIVFKTPFSPHDRLSIGQSPGISDSASADLSSRICSRSKTGSRQETPTKKPKLGKKLLAPEQKLILVAVRLAVLEKAASGLGVLAFVWATVVLLGGFVSTLSSYDFRLISILLLTEGTRIFSRSHEIEWQNAATKSSSLTKRLKSASFNALHKTTETMTSTIACLIGTQYPSSSRLHGSTVHSLGQQELHEKPQRTVKAFQTNAMDPLSAKRDVWSSTSLPLIPYAAMIDAKMISRMLYLLQLASASVNIGFSISRLSTNDYGGGEIDRATRSRNFAIKIFYGLALAEATIFLIERAYWEFEIRWQKLVMRVNKEGHFDNANLEMMTQFFYDVYSKCLAGSVFDGLEMDLVHFAITKIQSGIGSEQLGGVRMLSIFAIEGISGDHTLRKIGTTLGAVDRLVEMLTWKSKNEKQVRIAAAVIIRQLVKNQNNCHRVVSMAGALDAIVSLLIDKELEENEELTGNAHFSAPKKLKLCGLKILKNLANVRSNHVQIGNVRGLLHILISSIEVKNKADLQNTDEVIDIKVFKKSLQLLRQLATSSRDSSQHLGVEIGKSVYVLRNLRDILEHGSQHTLFQEYSVDILTSMALDGQMREKIGCTGGIIRTLLALFLKNKSVEENSPNFLLSLKAGEALHLLVVQNPKNCLRMIYLDDVCSRQGSSETLRELIRLFVTGHPRMTTCTANILRSLCAYLDETARKEIAGSIDSIPHVLRTAIETHGKQQEAFLGLAAYTIPLLQSSEFNKMFTEDFDKYTMLKRFMDFVPDLPSHPRLPRIRRHCVELANALMLQDNFFLQTFRKEGLSKHLKTMLDTMSDLENYYTYSGAIGLTLHSQTMEQLIEKSLQLLHTNRNQYCSDPC